MGKAQGEQRLSSFSSLINVLKDKLGDSSTGAEVLQLSKYYSRRNARQGRACWCLSSGPRTWDQTRASHAPAELILHGWARLLEAWVRSTARIHCPAKGEAPSGHKARVGPGKWGPGMRGEGKLRSSQEGEKPRTGDRRLAVPKVASSSR